VLQEKEKELKEKTDPNDMMILVIIYGARSFKSFEILMILKNGIRISDIFIKSYYSLIFA